MAAADDHASPFSDDPYPDAGPPYVPASPEEEAAFRAAVQEGLHDVAAGRVISGEAILAWLRSWGTENELPRPECGD